MTRILIVVAGMLIAAFQAAGDRGRHSPPTGGFTQGRAFVGTNWGQGTTESDRLGAGPLRAGQHVLPAGRDDGEFLLDTGRVLGPEAGEQVEPAVAFGGTNFLVVWSDSRGGEHIQGSLISPEGIIQDSLGFGVATPACRGYWPDVAFDGTNYLVVWQDFRSAASADIYGARLSGAGVVLDSTGLAISQGVNSELNPAVAANSTGYLVVWQDKRSGSSYDIFGTLGAEAQALLAIWGAEVGVYAGGTGTPTVEVCPE